jgi:hypothetical protein
MGMEHIPAQSASHYKYSQNGGNSDLQEHDAHP